MQSPSMSLATVPRLTRREWEVAAMVATARSNREIASELYVNTKTIEFHLANLFSKLGVRNRTALAAWWLRQQHDTQAGNAARSPLAPGMPGI